jgi:hypothetical protein
MLLDRLAQPGILAPIRLQAPQREFTEARDAGGVGHQGLIGLHEASVQARAARTSAIRRAEARNAD